MSLFDVHIPDYTMDKIYDSVMKGWSLGSLKFIMQVEHRTGYWSKPKSRGGDRKSKKFREELRK